jgi:DNA-binding CsgD family transcriptional regulator
MLANPMVAYRQDGDAPEIAGARFAPLREHLLEFGGWYSICVAIPSAEHHTTSVMMVCRNEKSSRFSDAEVAIMQALAPHFAEAAAVNRAIWLPRSAGPGGLPVAVIDAEGRFVQTTGAFVRLFWPHAPPATAFLGDDALRALHKRQPWPLPGGKHMLYGQADDTGGFGLRIRSVSPLDQLSPRERQVATLFARGASAKAIAEQLGVAPTTARNHLQNLYAKLGVSQRAELLAVVSRP